MTAMCRGILCRGTGSAIAGAGATCDTGFNSEGGIRKAEVRLADRCDSTGTLPKTARHDSVYFKLTRTADGMIQRAAATAGLLPLAMVCSRSGPTDTNSTGRPINSLSRFKYRLAFSGKSAICRASVISSLQPGTVS